jgi:hypothetical protein
MKIRPLEGGLLHADGQTDDKARVIFVNFANAPKNRNIQLVYNFNRPSPTLCLARHMPSLTVATREIVYYIHSGEYLAAPVARRFRVSAPDMKK